MTQIELMLPCAGAPCGAETGAGTDPDHDAPGTDRPADDGPGDDTTAPSPAAAAKVAEPADTGPEESDEPATTDMPGEPAAAVEPEEPAAPEAPEATVTEFIPERMRTRKEVARELHICVRTLNSLLARRAIEYMRVGGSVRISREALERFKASRTVAAAA